MQPDDEGSERRPTGWTQIPGGGLRAGATPADKADTSQEEGEIGDTDGSQFNYADRPETWMVAEEAASQRPLPLAQPRVPDMEFAQRTMDAIPV